MNKQKKSMSPANKSTSSNTPSVSSPRSCTADTGKENVSFNSNCFTLVPHNPPITESTDIDVIARLTSEIKLLRNDLNTQLTKLSETVTKCTDKLALFENRLTTAETKIKLLEEQKLVNHFLQQRVSELEEQLNNQEQISTQNEIEIMGVNESPQENPVHLALCVAAKIGLALKEEDVDSVTRVGFRRKPNDSHDSGNTRPRPLVVRLLRRTKRNAFLQAGKSRHNITSADIQVAGPPQKLFFNERLTKSNRLLFRAARTRSRQSGYKFCWTKHGSIFIRKQEGNAAIRIRRVADLDRCFGCHTSSAAEKSQDVSWSEAENMQLEYP
ncbi:uncharacterized protein LOC134669308 [Cydia fagiglandana]|uniref:uncharacterized protein LOC134666900 n=1 Tax=Cydia fagiglandana TaxID=1458189 RepID=UPI002FEE03E7